MTEGENRPDHTGQPHPSPASAEYSGDNGKIALLGYVCLCLHLFFFGYLFVAAPQSYVALKLEDNWLENLTAVWFLLAGLLLFATARFERHFLRRGIYILGGIAMVFIAGEELSWGQRMFGFATPDFLLGLNQQDEFNVHNIDLQLTGIIIHWGVLILCAVTGAAFLCRKDTLLGIPRPSLLTMFGFLVALAYAFPLASRSFYDPTVILSDGRILLLLFCGYFLLSRQVQWLVISVATGTLVLVFLYVHEHISVLDTYAEFEVQEYLAGLVCLFYALELLAWRWAAPGWWAPLASSKLRVARVSLWRRRRRRLELAPEPGASRSPGWTLHFHRSPALWICSLVLVGSVGLALVNLLSYRAAVSAAEEIYRSIVSGAYGEPAGRSIWDVYLNENENRLVYFKEPCQLEDRAQRFFLHITPVAAEDLPGHRRQYGFDNRDFNFGAFRLGTTLEGGCIRTVLLPDYAISRIATGQYHEEEQFWVAEFSTSAAEEIYRSIVSGAYGEPAGRSIWDVYLNENENRLVYFKESCQGMGRAQRFFLHITPVAVADLPDHRRQYGFDNRDFNFGAFRLGTTLEGGCIRTVLLPDYAISRIATGQYHEEEQFWAVQFSPP